MRTHAQANRDAALRRLAQVNRSLAIAAAVGAGVITDVVANTASAHTHTAASSNANGLESKPTSAGTTAGAGAPRSAVRHRTPARHHAAGSDDNLQSSSAPSTVTPSQSSSASSSSASSSSPAVSSAPTVVAVSGGS